MLPLVQQLATCTNLPILVKANAGLPNLKTNEYDIDAQQFCDALAPHIQAGAGIIGGCCGTTPEYIQKLSTRYGSLCPIKRKPKMCIRDSRISGNILINQLRTPLMQRMADRTELQPGAEI